MINIQCLFYRCYHILYLYNFLFERNMMNNKINPEPFEQYESVKMALVEMTNKRRKLEEFHLPGNDKFRNMVIV
jgi:hypothetical protein